jgi:hypothetical protein
VPKTTADLVRRLVRQQVRPDGVREAAAIVIEDLRLKRYSGPDLRDFLAGTPAVDAKAYRLRTIVPPSVAAIRREWLLDHLRRIEADRLYHARRRRPGGTDSLDALVDFVDLAAGVLYLRERMVVRDRVEAGSRFDLRTLSDLSAWTFSPEEPTLFPLHEQPAAAPVAAPREAVRHGG